MCVCDFNTALPRKVEKRKKLLNTCFNKVATKLVFFIQHGVAEISYWGLKQSSETNRGVDREIAYPTHGCRDAV